MPSPPRPSVIVQILRGCGYSVVLVGIAVAILYPIAFVPAREKARRSSCASNLKQLSLGALSYSQDYDGRFPLKSRPGGDWFAWEYGTFPITAWGRHGYHLSMPKGGPLYSYVKNGCMSGCPSDPALFRRDLAEHPRSSYLWNDKLCGKLIDDCTGQPLIWDRQPWHRHLRNVSYLTRDGNSVVRLVP